MDAKFQSTLPAGGATGFIICFTSFLKNFNPRSPHGERLESVHSSLVSQRFQSTLPAWGATLQRRSSRKGQPYFNPRSPQGERPFSTMGGQMCSYFNPRSPQGERQANIQKTLQDIAFQSTLPAGGATRLYHSQIIQRVYFNPRSPQGERR